MSSFLEAIRGPDILAVQIWECDPLVVIDVNGAVVFAQRTQAEYTPEEGGLGSIRALTADEQGICPQLQITHRQEWFGEFKTYFRTVTGLILFGEDKLGAAVTWYINRAADQFLIEQARIKLDLAADIL